MSVDNLPTEILCTIFELSARMVEGADQLLMMPEDYPTVEGGTPRLRGPLYADPAMLPPLKNCSKHCLALSHVCRTWRAVAINLRVLWTKVYLGNVSVCHGETTQDILRRSGAQLIDLHCRLPQRLTLDEKTFDELRETLQKFMPAAIPRCRSLRVEGIDIFIMAVLDTFIDHMLISPLIGAVNSKLSALYIVQTSSHTPTSHRTCYYSPDLGVIAPNVTTLRVDGALVSVLPRWHLRHATLAKGAFLSYKSHHNIFNCSAVTTLVLDGAVIPSTTPHVRGITHTRESTVRNLVVSDLRLQLPQQLPPLPRDNAEDNEDEGDQVDSAGDEDGTTNPPMPPSTAEYRSEAYATFFALSLPCSLVSLTLAHLSQDAISGFVAVIRYNGLPTTCPQLRELRIRGTLFGRMAYEGMTRAFPNLSDVELEDVGGRRVVFFDVWRNGVSTRPQQQVWPMLGEVISDGELILRGNRPLLPQHLQDLVQET
ncbi:hypothetical protein NLJ89_g7191 [Agrocybe chaxingu]|uniref:F-box domain-containing protein n=1 Tax=Agrocybe chaxingu TaxID=84603 RepID=A0A9W8MVA5_9AGAR|nr:hypothetical protein NLJ89_g7191 [Agrocybe chaxingu]